MLRTIPALFLKETAFFWIASLVRMERTKADILKFNYKNNIISGRLDSNEQDLTPKVSNRPICFLPVKNLKSLIVCAKSAFLIFFYLFFKI